MPCALKEQKDEGKGWRWEMRTGEQGWLKWGQLEPAMVVGMTL